MVNQIRRVGNPRRYPGYSVTNPYRPPSTTGKTDKRYRISARAIVATVVFIGGILIALSAMIRLHRYGGLEVLKTLSPAERMGAALWAATHVIAILSMLVAGSGILNRSNLKVLLGVLLFGAVCVFAWAWPMDFLWFN